MYNTFTKPYFELSPGLIAITFPSITDIAPLVAAPTKSLCIYNIVNMVKYMSHRD